MNNLNEEFFNLIESYKIETYYLEDILLSFNKYLLFTRTYSKEYLVESISLLKSIKGNDIEIDKLILMLEGDLL